MADTIWLWVYAFKVEGSGLKGPGFWVQGKGMDKWQS